MKQQLLLSEVARLLKKKPHQVVYAITSGAVEDVGRFGGRRVFRPKDVQRLAQHFGLKLAPEFVNVAGGSDEK